MDCLDTAVLICSYLSQCEAVEFANISRLCRRAARAHVGLAEFRYFTGECTREDFVELAPPCRVFGLLFVESSHQLIVLGRSEVCSGDVECFLYVQEHLSDGGRREHCIDLPASFANLSCAPWFEGDRFLCGTTHDDVAVVFDCATEVQLEVPFGMEAFRASPDGTMCVVDVNQHLYFCATAHCVSTWWEMHQSETVHRRGGIVSVAPPIPTRLRAELDVSRAAHQHPLGNSSGAWHSCWVGNSSVVHAHEGGVTLFRAVAPLGERSRTTTGEPAFETVTLCVLSTASSVLSNSSRSDVAVLPSGGDEYVFLTCRDFQLHVIRTNRVGTGQAPAKVTKSDLLPLLPSHCGIKGVSIVDPGKVYMAHVQYAHEDHVFFFSADLSLHRWVAVGRPSYVALHRGAGVLVAAPTDLMESTSDHHLLLEVVEGGVGNVMCFSDPTEARPHQVEAKAATTASETIAPSGSAEVTVVATAIGNLSISGSSGSNETGDRGGSSGFLSWIQSSNKESAALSGVEALSWLAFGIVSASLIWTLSALCYNGWWLHVQLLFCGKIA